MTNLTAWFWDRLALKYSKGTIANQAAYQKKLEITQDFLKPDMNVLEIGCGTGSTAIIHAPYVKHIRATDVSSNMLKIASEKVQTGNIDNITFEHCGISDLQVPDQSLDVVLALNILHLLGNRTEVIAKVEKMLKPGGVFVSSTVCMGEGMGFAKIIAPIGRVFGLVLKIFSTRQLRDEMLSAGFTIEHDWQPEGGKSVFIVARKTEG